MHNAETLAHVAMITRMGAHAFRARGLLEDPGTCLVTISGAVEQPSMMESAPVPRLLDVSPRRATPTGTPRALLVGGYGGAWVGAGALPRHPTRGCRCAPSGPVRASEWSSCSAQSCGLMESARTPLPGRPSAGQWRCIQSPPSRAASPARRWCGCGPHAKKSWSAPTPRSSGRGACRHPRRSGQPRPQCPSSLRRRSPRPHERRPVSVRGPPTCSLPGEPTMIRIVIDPTAVTPTASAPSSCPRPSLTSGATRSWMAGRCRQNSSTSHDGPPGTAHVGRLPPAPRPLAGPGCSHRTTSTSAGPSGLGLPSIRGGCSVALSMKKTDRSSWSLPWPSPLGDRASVGSRAGALNQPRGSPGGFLTWSSRNASIDVDGDEILVLGALAPPALPEGHARRRGEGKAGQPMAASRRDRAAHAGWPTRPSPPPARRASGAGVWWRRSCSRRRACP